MNLVSDDGGITLTAGLATADAINLAAVASGSGIDIDGGTGGINLDVTATGVISIATAAVDQDVAIGNSTASSAVTIISGGSGDITLSSADTLLFDAVGVLELNSSGGIISLGNDPINQNIKIGTGGNRAIEIGNAGSTSVILRGGDGSITVSSSGASVVADAFTVAGGFAVNAAGAITDVGAITSDATGTFADLILTTGDLDVDDGTLIDVGTVNFTEAGTPLEVTDGNLIAVTQTYHAVKDDDANDALTTITGGVPGDLLILQFTAAVVITDSNTGTLDGIDIGAAFTAAAGDTLTLVFFNDTTDHWVEIARDDAK